MGVMLTSKVSRPTPSFLPSDSHQAQPSPDRALFWVHNGIWPLIGLSWRFSRLIPGHTALQPDSHKTSRTTIMAVAPSLALVAAISSVTSGD